ncbi:MAG TPA: hypothetical protein VFV81_00970 [Verrucomicrobiae bacterium]|nr:hypothetical protein [Verrucomicrobiae bacterium]
MNAKTAGWKALCSAIARAGDAFAVHHLQETDLEFCREFCQEFHYSFELDQAGDERIATFTPKG